MKYLSAFPFAPSNLSACSTEPLPSSCGQLTAHCSDPVSDFELNPQFDTLFGDLIPEEPWDATTEPELPTGSPTAINESTTPLTAEKQHRAEFKAEPVEFTFLQVPLFTRYAPAGLTLHPLVTLLDQAEIATPTHIPLPVLQAPSAEHVANIAVAFSGNSNSSYSRNGNGFSRNGGGSGSYHHGNGSGNSSSNGNGNGNSNGHGWNSGNGNNGGSYKRQSRENKASPYKPKDSEPQFQIVRHIGVVYVNPRSGWRMELNVVSWNYGPAQYDIREWSPDHKRMGRGITLDEGKFINLFAVMTSEIEHFVGQDASNQEMPPAQTSAVASVTAVATEPASVTAPVAAPATAPKAVTASQPAPVKTAANTPQTRAAPAPVATTPQLDNVTPAVTVKPALLDATSTAKSAPHTSTSASHPVAASATVQQGSVAATSSH